MSILNQCPQGSTINDIPLGCDFKIGQVQKIIVMLTFSTGITKNKWVKAVANPNVKASWTPRLSATNGTKVVQTPFMVSPNIEPGKPVSSGSGNDALSGAASIIGEDPSVFTAKFENLNQLSYNALRTFNAGVQISIAFVDEHGHLFMNTDDMDNPTVYYPLPVCKKTFFVGSRKGGQFNVNDVNEITFMLFPGWDEKLVRIVPEDFDALSDLATINS